ncbi:hypothetical protein [Dyadobacter frigoris]|uniref:Baseplate protein J-like domain-containing protein n=1 Tax=Dyadobacter frigoris TaxID=2576211 RepID=A0A4U6CYM9_9BACT|nr:hypothetical protein [Dyadobacter frigoris]TKT89466.1 hypothetical protein FDK13_24295 [Dyadobacter frigoris]
MRTLDEIKADIDVTKVQFSQLDALDSTSDVSFWTTLRNMWAHLVLLVESSYDSFQAKVDLQIASTSIGSLPWYVDQVKSFQFGDPVSILNGRVTYDTIDESKRIVFQSAVTEDTVTGRLAIKAIKANSVPLTTDELTALKEYVSKVKYAGVLADVSSLEADDLKLIVTVKVDKQVIGSNGLLLSDTTKAPVQDAIAVYLRSLPYTSVISNTALTDAVQAVKGVLDFTITGSFTKRPVSVTWVAYQRETVSLAGHALLHNDSLFTYIN